MMQTKSMKSLKKKIFFYDPLEAGKLECDSCGYIVEEKQPLSERLIGFRCPKCGDDMLTRRDYELTVKTFRFFDFVNRWFGPIFGKSETAPSDKVIVMRWKRGILEVKERE